MSGGGNFQGNQGAGGWSPPAGMPGNYGWSPSYGYPNGGDGYNNAPPQQYPNQTYYNNTPAQNTATQAVAAPDPWAGISQGRLGQARRFANAGQFGRAKQQFELGGGTWSPQMSHQMRAWAKGNK